MRNYFSKSKIDPNLYIVYWEKKRFFKKIHILMFLYNSILYIYFYSFLAIIVYIFPTRLISYVNKLYILV